MHLTRLRLLALAAASSLLLACPSTSTMTLARTMPAGRVQGLLSPGLVINTAPDSATKGSIVAIPKQFPMPQVEAGIRYAVSDHVEVGGKIWAVGGALDTKVALVRPESDESGVNVALDPGISYLGSAGTLTTYLPVLVGVRLSHHELVIAPRVVGMWQLGSSGTVSGSLWGGGSMGFAARVMPGFRFMPEISYLNRMTQFGAPVDPTNALTEHLVQVGVGALMGGD